jgi:hypothetical protein
MADEHPSTEFMESPAADFNTHQFLQDRGLNRTAKATLVQVTKVSTTGQVAPVGTVSVSPLVKMQDALGNVHPHSEMHNLPYFRMQGGADKAVILDPKVGDIGVAVFADRDISTAVKNNSGWDGTKKVSDAQAPPGSFRQHDMADGMFFGCFLGGKPKSYIQFKDDGSINMSPDEGTTSFLLEKNKATLTATQFIVNGTSYLGGPDASLKAGMVGTVDTDGDALTQEAAATKVFMK